MLKLIKSLLSIPIGGMICGCGGANDVVVEGNDDVNGASCDSKVTFNDVPLISFTASFSSIPDNKDL